MVDMMMAVEDRAVNVACEESEAQAVSAAYKEFEVLMRLLKEIDDMYDDYARNLGLPLAAFWILYAVFSHEKECAGEDGLRARPYTQRRLCDEWSMTPQTVNSSLKKMCEQGLVELVPVASNKREKGIVLADAGARLAEELVTPLRRKETRAFFSVDEADRAAMFRALGAFKRALALEMGVDSCM